MDFLAGQLCDVVLSSNWPKPLVRAAEVVEDVGLRRAAFDPAHVPYVADVGQHLPYDGEYLIHDGGYLTLQGFHLDEQRQRPWGTPPNVPTE
jgi:hypothetical protein